MTRDTLAGALAAVLLLLLSGCSDPEPTATDPEPTESTSESTPSEPATSDTESPSPTDDPTTEPPPGRTIPGYYLGTTPQGIRLYREFRKVAEAEHGLADNLGMVMTPPLDPDYRTLWPEGAFAGADFGGDVLTVELADGSLRDRPSGMTKREARMSIEQVIYTMQAAVQERAPVQFVFEDNPIDQVLGVPTSEPLAHGVMLETLALVNVTSPKQGAPVSGSFTASGVASSFEATVPWEIRRGEEVVKRGFATADGWMGRLYPWETEVDVSGLAPGEYTFVAMTSDPSGGAEGAGPHRDTKTITVD